MSKEMKKRILCIVEKAVAEKDRKNAKQGPIGCTYIFHQPVRPHKKNSDK
jgi:hypothetical protein